MRPRGLSSSSPSNREVGQVAVQKPQCTHERRMASASRPSGVSFTASLSDVCIIKLYTIANDWRLRRRIHPPAIEDPLGVESLHPAQLHGQQGRRQGMETVVART